MQRYFFDIYWNDETIRDDEGTSHFDVGSALYYGRMVGSRLARCGKGDAVRVHMLDDDDRLVSIITPGAIHSLPEQQERVREIVERDRKRQALMAG